MLGRCGLVSKEKEQYKENWAWYGWYILADWHHMQIKALCYLILEYQYLTKCSNKFSGWKYARTDVYLFIVHLLTEVMLHSTLLLICKEHFASCRKCCWCDIAEKSSVSKSRIYGFTVSKNPRASGYIYHRIRQSLWYDEYDYLEAADQLNHFRPD